MSSLELVHMFPAVSCPTGACLRDTRAEFGPRELEIHGALVLTVHIPLLECKYLKSAISLLKPSLFLSRFESGKDKVGIFPRTRAAFGLTGESVQLTVIHSLQHSHKYTQAYFRLHVERLIFHNKGPE